jgi:hypothetical protein
MSSPFIFCPRCGHKSRIRPDCYGKKVKCLYCLESFVASPDMTPGPRRRLLFWAGGVVMVIAVSAYVYSWQQNRGLTRRLHENEAQYKQIEEEIQKSRANKSTERYYVVSFSHIDDEGKLSHRTDEVSASSRNSAESLIRGTYRNVLTVSSVVEREK